MGHACFKDTGDKGKGQGDVNKPLLYDHNSVVTQAA